MRNISFAMTVAQIQARTKTVTRRFGWAVAVRGVKLRPVRKVMGFKKGEKIDPLLPDDECIKVDNSRWEPLNAITKADCILEGFPEMEPEDFVAMMVKYYKCKPDKPIHRIEFKYVRGSK